MGEVNDYLRTIGRRGGLIGGKRSLETMTAEQRQERGAAAARARWGAAQWTKQQWPVGTEFEIKVRDQWIGGWIITRYTTSRVYFYKPEYDGAERFVRKATCLTFATDINDGVIRKVKKPRTEVAR